MRFSFLVILMLAFSFTNAQQARVQSFKASLCGSVNLSAIEDKYNAQVFSLEMPEPDEGAEADQLAKIKEECARLFPRKKGMPFNKTTAIQKPVLVKGYIADTLPGIPPDNDMAISKDNKSVSVLNSNIAVHDATTGQMIYRKTLKLFSTAVGLNNTFQDYRYDPKIMYDPQADKFICVMLNGTNDHNWIVMGFSTSNDPAGTWHFYKFYGNYSGDTTWFDYPTVAITEKEFFLTGNKLKFNSSWQTGFVQSVIYQVNKQSGYNGDSLLSYQIWDSIALNGRNLRNLYPVKGGDKIYGPEQYFLSNRNFDVQNDTVFLVKMPDTIGTNNNNLTITPLVSNKAYGVPPSGRQPDTSAVLATNDGRILGAFRVGNEIQFTSASVDTNYGNSAVYHGIVSNFSTAPSLSAQLFSVDSLDFGYPNLSYAGIYTGQIHSIISFNYTGPNTQPGMGAIYFDGNGCSDMLDVKQGLGSIKQLTGKDQRWGDYKGSQLDWNATGVVWIEGIFGRSDKNYGNYIAQIASPFYNSVQENSINTKQILYPNPSQQFIKLEFNLQEPENLSFFIFDVQGKMVDRILQQHCEEGKNIIQFNVVALANGIYFLKAKDETGNMVMTHRFMKE